MPIRVKDHSKCNEWERRRRDRLNDAFKNLAQLLPHYDPARIPAKIDILEKSTEFVKELRLSNSRLLSNQAETDEKCKLIKQLQDEVNRLILRVKQLTVLLKKASITIPIGPEIKSLGSKRMKWSGKLKPEDVENAAISDGATPCGETVPVAEKVPTTLSGAVSNQTLNISTQPFNDIITNSSAINTSVASIIVPLKETNLSNTIGCDSANSKAPVTSIPPIIITSATSSVSTSEPTKVTFTSVMTTCSSQSSPIKVITTSKPIFTTATSTPIQLPLQTFIIAPCPITGSTQALPTQNPQIVTRIANILSTPIVPKTVDGLPCFKVPIKSLLKPIPKVIKRRRRKKKNEIVIPPSTNAPSSALKLGTQVVVQPEKDKITKDKITKDKDSSNENVSSAATKPTTALTDDKNKESVEPDVEPDVEKQNVSTNLETNNEKEKNRDEEESFDKNMREHNVPESSDLVKSDETLPVSIAETSIVEKAPEKTKVIDITEGVEMEVEKMASCTATTASVADGSIEEHISEEQRMSDDKPTNQETQECDNIPVLRIIEASDEGGVVHDNIMSTVVVESSSTETIAEKGSTDHVIQQTKVMEDKDISKTNVESPSTEKVLKETTKTCSDLNVTKTNLTEISQIEPTSKMSVNETEKAVCEIPSNDSVQNNASSMEKQQQDNMDNITEPCVSKEKMNYQKDKEEKESSSLEDSRKKDATVLGQNKSPTTNAPILTECHNLSPIYHVPNSNSETMTSMTPAKETKLPESSSKEMCDTFSQKQTEPTPLEPLTQLPDKSLHDTVQPQTSSTFSSNQREESSKVVATIAHKTIMDTTETVTTDKISECIARSIDLIDANDSELMALGEHWEDSGASPKSISPTQIFLNIFPLLPRESSINDQHHSQTTHQLSQNPSVSTFQPTSKNLLPFTPSSNSRSSFFIDAMLPDDHPPSSSTEITEPISTSLPSSHSPFLPLTPPQYSSLAPTSQQISSPFSLSSNYYWTPQTIPSSSNADTNFMDYRNTSNINIFSLDENQRSCVSSSSSLAPTSTLTSIASVKTSTVPPVSTTLSVTTPILSTTASKTKSKSSENHGTTSSKRQKTESSGKLAFMTDSNLPSFSKDKKTKTSLTTSTSTNVTWTATTTTTSSTLHASTFQQSASQNVPAMESIGHSSSTPSSSGTQKIPYHSCSLLDALNPMDASFFRPLINALDGHDFRSLDFPGGNSLPPPPLPPLITPSTKSLYSSHINPTPQPVHNSSINTPSYSSHHQHSFMQPNQPMTMFNSNVPPASSNKSHSEITCHGSKHHNKPMQEYQSVTTISSQQETRSSLPSKPVKSQASSVPNSGTEKTSRTSGRQKHESKQGRSGKSSRTQPYTTPSSTSQTITDQKQTQKQDHNTPNATPKASRTHSFHTIHSHINPCTDLSSSYSRNYEFSHIEPQSLTSNKASNPVKVKPSSTDKPAPVSRTQASKSTESKTQKSKEQKAQSSHSSSIKQPTRSSQSSFSIGQQIPSQSQTSSSVSLKSTSSQASTKVNSVGSHQTNFSRSSQETEISKPSQSIQNSSSSVSQPTSQLQQPSGESLSLFPDFSTFGSNCNTARQFAGGQSHAPQYYQNDTSNMQQHQEQPASVSNFPIQRTQPYYFPDISSFENFPAVHHNQGQPQIPLVTQQVHHPSLNRQAVSEPSNNYGQNQPHSETHEVVSHSTKCTYGSNPSTASNTNSNQPEFQHAHVQHQPTTRQHQNYFVHQDNYHHNQQPTNQHHNATLVQPSENQRHQSQFPTYQQQVQHQPIRSHTNHPHSNTSTATTSTTIAVSSVKEKQQHSTPVSALTFHSHSTSQQQQPLHHQQTTSQIQQNLSQPTNRTSSKTVNWMTDAGYRSNNSSSTATNKQQRQSTVALASTSNPFSVSKLVGTTTGTVVPPKLQQTSATRNGSATSGIGNSNKNQQHQAIPSHNNNVSTHTTRQTKSSRNNTSSNSSSAGTGTTPTHSQNQSNYCAEALIRKNPPAAPATNDWMNDFNLVSSTNQSFQGSNYSDGHHHSSSHSHTHQHQNQNPATENFSGSYTSNICGGSYHYQTGAASSTPSTNASHFPHFDQVQPQYNMTHHRNHHHHPHAVQTSTPSSYDHTQQRLHNSPAHSSQTHDMQINTASQMHYSQQHQHHHHHHQIHLSNQHPQTHSSSSSVTNFNLSTIFPEINDKRSTNNSSSLGAQVQGGSTSSGNNNSNAGGSGGDHINSSFGYQHSSFASSTNGPGNIR